MGKLDMVLWLLGILCMLGIRFRFCVVASFRSRMGMLGTVALL
jgi:hypothetical protein